MANGMLHSGCKDLTQATTHMVIILVSRMQKRGTGDNNFVKIVNGNGHFNRTNQNDQTSQTEPPSKVVPNIPVGPNRNGLLHVISN